MLQKFNTVLIFYFTYLLFIELLQEIAPVLVVLKHQRRGMFMAVTTWCDYAEENSYFHYFLYANG